MNSDSEQDFEAIYEAGDEDKDGDVGVEAATENVVVHPSVSQPMIVPPFMRNLDLDAMHASKFLEYVNIEFRIGIEYSSRKSVVTAIGSYTISRGVDYNVYKFEPHTFYAKCKMYGRGCDWLIRASLIWKKRHIGSNFLRALKVPHLQKFVVNIGYSGKVEEYNINYKRPNEVFEVRKMPSEKVLVVDLTRRTCNCGYFQVERLPFRHVIAYCANQCLDWQLYVHDMYKMTEVRKVYRFEFTPLGDPETWPVYQGPTLVANPTLRQTLKGRPKLTQYLNEMD
ncbi:hypothetical protein Ahy_A08g037634 [Arachis hypogaea]|uniref:Transposase MuDR plant domain-containing protein n=1 Tax=Arachis hypogaea TaxID=3818 RepID=A0A445BRB9_ARAHY|nr:hypothetical protein Ahy_A08g037634 [Arachis hypogaea]